MDVNGVNQIIGALGIVHSPTSSNVERRQAQDFLERIKQQQESPYWGYQLALPDNNNDYIVKHFGLSLLQSSISNHYDDFDLNKQITVRNWIIELSNKLLGKDPHYMKEKLAFLWVDLAKRSWGTLLYKQISDTNNDMSGSENGNNNASNDNDNNSSRALSNEDLLESWKDMDKDLWQLWNLNACTRELTFIIFRTLFEDIYILEDPIAIMRAKELSSLCPEIVTSSKILSLKYEPNEQLSLFRASDEGWLITWSNLLQECLNNLNSIKDKDNAEYKTSENFVIKILQTLKTCLHWILPIAIREAHILARLTQCFMFSRNVTIRILATESLHALFTRSFSDQEDFSEIVGAIFTKDGINMLSQGYHSIQLDPDDIDDQLYSLLKKMVEMILGLTEYLNTNTGKVRAFELAPTSDIRGYLNLVLETTNNESLIVSGLSLQFWSSVLRIDQLASKPEYQELLPKLLEVASNRLINYEDFNDELPAKKYLEVDFEEQSDISVFLANYRKLMDDVVRITVCQKPKDGLNWLEARLNQFYCSPLGQENIANNHLTYKGDGAECYIYGYSQFIIIEACIRGISRWHIWYDDKHEDKQQKAEYLNTLVESLCEKLLMLQIKDPLLLRKQVQTLVQFSPLLKDFSNNLMFRVLEKVILSCTYEYPENSTDEERENIRDLRTSCGTELNRLAYLMPESLKVILNDLEVAISNILSSNKVTDHEAVAFKSFLLVVSQRSSIDNKVERFSKIVDPELAAWSDPTTEKGLLELPWFMERLGIVKIAEYFQSRGITSTTNLLDAEMDDTGRNLKNELKKHWSSVFPIRATRIFIQYSIEKLPHDSEEYQNLLKLWKPRIQPILPHILQLIHQIQSYHDPNNWQDLPVEVQSFVKYSCMERFWQQGVSIQSKETFMEENVKAMHTLRDFADSVGHIVRYTREYSYLTIGSISELEETLYEVPNMATQLWQAVAGSSVGITLHSWRHLINLVLRCVIKNCPLKFVDTFMAELLPQVLTTLDNLLLKNWERIYLKGLQLSGNEDDQTLSEEMMEEHLLRQLTAVVDRMLIDLVGQLGHGKLNELQKAIRNLIFNNANILAIFLQLLNHIILFKDTRCSYNAILIMRNLISDVLLRDEEVDKYITNTFIKTLVTIINDPFFADCKSEAGYLLTSMYLALRKKHQYPQDFLNDLINEISNGTDDKKSGSDNMFSIKQLEEILNKTQSIRMQKNMMVTFITVDSNSDLEGTNGAGSGFNNNGTNRKKDLEEANNSRKKKTDGSNIEDYTGLNNLFGDDV
ncbi:hypothetical protein PACTADRAFT_32749 [Pachysolen tannophilus NRRL Y-2460]|uniref:Exportin-5 C-terminal domain-containing protein n=1 Tax=Pachysolen tannophilus NRRL Y-2460 TaxID=669874 RepID=A0A1E4TZU9_PACTA|nr:hypothetical protein PACTADRAFT_32749 [Pachysolen tannophilus NRRL Y-2460]